MKFKLVVIGEVLWDLLPDGRQLDSAAAMTLDLLAGWEPDRINEHANRVASFVCSQAGATRGRHRDCVMSLRQDEAPPEAFAGAS